MPDHVYYGQKHEAISMEWKSIIKSSAGIAYDSKHVSGWPCRAVKVKYCYVLRIRICLRLLSLKSQSYRITVRIYLRYFYRLDVMEYNFIVKRSTVIRAPNQYRPTLRLYMKQQKAIIYYQAATFFKWILVVERGVINHALTAK